MRQALAGMLWSKQFYHYVVRDWLKGDPGAPAPPAERVSGRNHEWSHLYNADVISMPDKWEYPWYAAWDLAFHCVPLALVDCEFAKQQLVLMTARVVHASQRPAPRLRVGVRRCQSAGARLGGLARLQDRQEASRTSAIAPFWTRIFHKLLLNFTWWVNRKDSEGPQRFSGRLSRPRQYRRLRPQRASAHRRLHRAGRRHGLDGDVLSESCWPSRWNWRAKIRPTKTSPASSGSTSCTSRTRSITWAATARACGTKRMASSMMSCTCPTDGHVPLKVRSMVGLIPLFAVETLEPRICDRLDGFKRRLEWFVRASADLTHNVACMHTPGQGTSPALDRRSATNCGECSRVMLDEREFLSPYGIRAFRASIASTRNVLRANGMEYRVDYEPGESSTGLFGGNSNWRGPIWFPVNFLLIESLAEVPSLPGRRLRGRVPDRVRGHMMTLWEVAAELSRRMTRIFLKGSDGRRPVHVRSANRLYHEDPNWQDLVLFL